MKQNGKGRLAIIAVADEPILINAPILCDQKNTLRCVSSLYTREIPRLVGGTLLLH